MTQELIDLPGNTYAEANVLIDETGQAMSLMTPEAEVAFFGTFRGRPAKMDFCFGFRNNGWQSSSVLGDVSEYLDTSQSENTPVVAGTQYYIRSSSTQDGIGGTGIRTMRINTLNTLNERRIFDVNLNGTTAVSLGTDISFVQYMESAVVGSTGLAAGDITISSVTGAPTVAQTIEKVVAGVGKSRSGRMKVPKGVTLYLLGWGVSAVGNSMDVKIRSNVFSDTRLVSPGATHHQQAVFVASNANYSEDTHYIKFPELSEIKLSAIPGATAAGNRCSGSFHFLVVENA